MGNPPFIGKTSVIGQVLQAKIPLIKNEEITESIQRRWMDSVISSFLMSGILAWRTWPMTLVLPMNGGLPID